MIVGIRPESFEDAELVGGDTRDRGMTFRAKIDLVEQLGAEQYAYFSSSTRACSPTSYGAGRGRRLRRGA